MPQNKNNQYVVNRNRWLFVVTAAIMTFSGFGCGPGGGQEPAVAQPAGTESQTMKLVANQQQRDIVRRAQLTVRVPDISVAEKSATAFVNSIGGFVESSESTNYDQTRPQLSMTVRVPVGRFESALSTFEGLGTRLHKTVTSEDVTTQLVDQEARLKTMLAQEESLRNILRSSRKIADTLTVQKNLMQLRADIESLAAQRKSLAGLAALSTIRLELTSEAKLVPASKDGDWLKESWTSSTNLLGAVARGLGSMAVFVGVFSPFWLPPTLLFVWLLRRTSKARTPS